MKSCNIRVPGKCILAGEHAVLQGYSLLAKAIKHYYVYLEYTDNQDPINLDIDLNSTLSNECLMHFFYSLLKRAIGAVGKDLHSLTGTFYVYTNIPISSGLGFSAAICIAMTHWIKEQGWLGDNDTFKFSCYLEDLFHGKSSGADIAASGSDDMILFQTNKEIEPIAVNWEPHLYIKPTGSICYTSEAVKKVNDFREKHKQKAKAIDLKMHNAALKIMSALKTHHDSHIDILMEGINDANECFKSWDLIPDELASEMKQLSAAGAIAVKPTGSGGGGCILSLWRQPPSKNIAETLVRVF